MKKYLSILFVVTLGFSFGASLALAGIDEVTENAKGRDSFMLNNQENKETLQQEREKIKAEIEKAREEAKTKMETLKASIKAEKDAVKAKLLEARILGREQALERFDNAMTRITDKKNKVNEIIAKFEAKGVDATIAKGFVNTAETKLEEAKTKITEASTLLSTSVNKLTVEEKTKLKTLTQETQTLLKDAHLALIDAIKSLKEAFQAKQAEDKVETETENLPEVE